MANGMEIGGSAARRGVALLGQVVLPQTCAACGRLARSGEVLCGGCEIRLESGHVVRGDPPPGIDLIAAAAHHDGVAREMISALKHRRVLGVADRMAELLVERVGGAITATLVPAPSAPSRRRKRGFDPARELARALGRASGVEVSECLRRGDGPRQVGQRRGARRAGRFEVECSSDPPGSCVLIDDVATTGGTLTACAIALRAGGAETVSAVTFTRRR